MEQERLSRERAGIQRQLDAYQADAKLVRQHVDQALDLLEDCSRLYAAAPDHLKKLLNQVFFECILVNPLVDDEGRVIMPDDDGGTDTDGSGDGNEGAHSMMDSDEKYTAGQARWYAVLKRQRQQLSRRATLACRTKRQRLWAAMTTQRIEPKAPARPVRIADTEAGISL